MGLEKIKTIDLRKELERRERIEKAKKGFENDFYKALIKKGLRIKFEEFMNIHEELWEYHNGEDT